MVSLTAWTTAIVVANTVTLACGGLVTYYALRAYRRTGSPALYSLTIGLGAITFGALVGGTLHQFDIASIQQALAVQSGFSALGFATMAYSLYARAPSTVTTEMDPRNEPETPES